MWARSTSPRVGLRGVLPTLGGDFQQGRDQREHLVDEVGRPAQTRQEGPVGGHDEQLLEVDSLGEYLDGDFPDVVYPPQSRFRTSHGPAGGREDVGFAGRRSPSRGLTLPSSPGLSGQDYGRCLVRKFK